MNPAIIIVTGIMASGKSTVAELLSRRFARAVHLRGDVFRRMITSGREEMTEAPSEEALRQLRLRYDIAASAAKMYCDGGFTVVLQDNYLCEDLGYIVSQFAGYPLYVVVLNPSIEAVKRREEVRGKKGYVGFTVEGLHDVFVKETPRIGLWIDTSDMTAEQTVDEVMERLDDGRLMV